MCDFWVATNCVTLNNSKWVGWEPMSANCQSCSCVCPSLLWLADVPTFSLFKLKLLQCKNDKCNEEHICSLKQIQLQLTPSDQPTNDTHVCDAREGYNCFRKEPVINSWQDGRGEKNTLSSLHVSVFESGASTHNHRFPIFWMSNLSRKINIDDPKRDWLDWKLMQWIQEHNISVSLMICSCWMKRSICW